MNADALPSASPSKTHQWATLLGTTISSETKNVFNTVTLAPETTTFNTAMKGHASQNTDGTWRYTNSNVAPATVYTACLKYIAVMRYSNLASLPTSAPKTLDNWKNLFAAISNAMLLIQSTLTDLMVNKQSPLNIHTATQTFIATVATYITINKNNFNNSLLSLSIESVPLNFNTVYSACLQYADAIELFALDLSFAADYRQSILYPLPLSAVTADISKLMSSIQGILNTVDKCMNNIDRGRYPDRTTHTDTYKDALEVLGLKMNISFAIVKDYSNGERTTSCTPCFKSISQAQSLVLVTNRKEFCTEFNAVIKSLYDSMNTSYADLKLKAPTLA